MEKLELSNIHTVCIRCGRKLRTPESRELGFGPTCYKKQGHTNIARPLFEVERSDEYATQ